MKYSLFAKKNSQKSLLPIVLPLLLSVFLTAILNAAPDQIVGELQDYVVEGITDDALIIPIGKPVESVFGMDKNIMAIPRGVSVINQTLLNDRGVDDVSEIVAFSPGAYAPGSFGNNTTPNIRGDVAETYINGQRRSANLFGVDPGFNSVAAIDLVRGPGSVTYGPGFQSGGYINYVTKKARFDQRNTTVTLNFGSWAPGHHSFFNNKLQIDTNIPLIEDKLAIRISYEGQENDTFFENNGGRDDFQDIFFTATWKANDRLTFDLDAHYTWQAAPQLLGANRPTQQLIDNDLILTGGITSPAVFNPDFTVKANVTGLTGFNPEDTLLSTGDFSNANSVNTQLVSALEISPNLKLINRTFGEFINRRRFHEFSYAEYVEQLTFENRTELHLQTEAFGRSHDILTGITLRYEEREAYVNYFNYYPNLFDITANNTFRAADVLGVFGTPGPGGQLFFGPNAGLPETTHSKVWNPALFWQHEFSPADEWSLLYGVRGDAYFADVTDPLPSSGALNDQQDFYNGSFNVSLTYQPSVTMSFYATFNRTSAVNGSTTGGGIMLFGGQIDKRDFRTRSDLYELGARFSLLDNRLYTTITLFRQERDRTEFGGTTSDIRVDGIELEAIYQPTQNFYLLSNLSYTEANYRNSSPFVLGGADLNNLYDTVIADLVNPARLAPASFGGVQLLPGNYRLSGISRLIFNFGSHWRMDSGLGFSFWGNVQSPQQGNLANQYTIPTQFTLNATVSWQRPGWEASVSFLNFTDEDNWVHNGDEFGSNVFISRALPLRIEGRLRWRF